MDAAVVLGMALLVGQRGAAQPWAAAILLCGALLLLRRELPRWLVVAALALAAAGAAGASWKLRDAELDRERARDALGAPSRCDAGARVEGSPVRKGDALRWTAELREIWCEGRKIEGTWRAKLYGGPDDLARGDELDVVVQLGAAQLFMNPDVADPRPSAARSGAVVSGSVLAAERTARGLGPGAWVDRARGHARARIDATYEAEAAPLARALVLGEEDLAPEDGEAFRKSGLAHLLAVSGTHLVVVVAGVVAALRALLLRVGPLAASTDVGRWAAGAGAVLAFVYADFAGASGSAMRAAAMMAAVLGARALGRRGDGPRALGLSLLALGGLDPLAAFDISLLLSAAATAGLMALGGPITRWLEETLPGPLARLSGALGPTLAATAACSPLIASLSPSLPVAGVLANVVAVPVGEAAALPLCLAHGLLSWLPLAERGVALAASGALLIVRAIARVSSAPSWAQLPVPPPTEAQAVIMALGALAIRAAGRGPRRAAAALSAAALLLLAEGLARREGRAPGRLRVTLLDVGQGDASLIDFPDGSTMLVDGGGFVGSPVDPGRSVVLPTLRARRRGRVDVAVLSHPHPDHFIGLAGALPELEVGELWDTGQGEEEGAGPVYAALLAGLRARGVAVVGPARLCGAPRRFGDALVEALAPCPGFTPFINANDNSLVLRISMGKHAALLTGDAEGEEERFLMETHGDGLRADLLKAGHHGSRTSTSAGFLARVRPSLVVLSCGVRNRFGHPHPRTLETLARAGVEAARTDRGGAVVWETDGHRTWTRRAGPPHPVTSR
jgi:competence protein ComEC